MTILRVLLTLDAVGGVWRYAIDLGAALARDGHVPVFAGLGPAPTPAQREEATAIGPLEWGAAPLDWMAAGAASLSGVSSWIETLTRRHRPDLLHLNLPSQAAGLRGGPPRVVVTHSCLATWFRAIEGHPPPDHLSWQAELTEAGLRNAHRVVAPSPAHAALTEATYGLTGIRVVHNASRSALVRPGPGDGRVVAAARWWDRAKNAECLDRAAGSCGAVVTMMGRCDGPDGQVFRPRHAHATGPLAHGQAMERIAAASLFVSPSLYEPFGLAALEAARAGRPLLLADIPVYRDLWNGAARFFDPHDAAGLSRRIVDLLAAPDERIALGAAAQRRSLRYALPNQASAMAAIYREIAAPVRVT